MQFPSQMSAPDASSELAFWVTFPPRMRSAIRTPVDTSAATSNETKHLPYGEGTLRADPLREALDRLDRPATVISESPDEASSQAIRSILLGVAAR